MKRSLISIDDLTIEEIREYLEMAHRIEHLPEAEKVQLLLGKVLAVLFFEPSTRTRLSFEAAMQRLGGSVIGFSDISSTSVKKGESFTDTIHTVECYSDVIVVRHPKEGSARVAGEVSSIPIINAGDGTNQHPTQTLLDLYTLKKFFGKVDGLRMAFAGDLKYSRTVHSLLHALMMFDDVELTFASPVSLRMPKYLRFLMEQKGVTFTETYDLAEAMADSDCLYMTRVQQERFPDLLDYEKVKNDFVLSAPMLKDVPDHFKVMHPLPRVNEIAYDIDKTKHAGYFPQVKNGMFMRQAILLDLLGVKI